MTKLAKAPAWTADQLAAMQAKAEANKNGFMDNDDCKALLLTADFGNKNLPQVRGKVTSMKIYKAATATSKPSATSDRKLDYVTSLENLLNVPAGSLASFEKAAKPQLQLAVEKFIEISTLREVEDQE